MSKMLKAPAILNSLMNDCIAAWELTDQRVHFDQVRSQNPGLEYAIIKLLPVEMGALAARTVYQNYIFEIRRRAKFPATGNLLLWKIAQADLLIDQIIDGPNYNGLAYLPYITGFDPTEDDDPQNQFVEFTVTFSCQVEENHH